MFSSIFSTKNYFAFMLMLYVTSTLLFSLGSNIIISRLIDLILIGSYLFYLIFHAKIKIHIHSFLWFYLFFAIYALMSSFWSIDNTISITESFRIMIIGINMIFIYSLSKQFKIERFILYGFILAALYNYAIAFDIISFTSKYTIYNIHRFVGTSNNSNVMAIYMLFNVVSSILLIEENKLEKKSLYLNIFLFTNILLAIYIIILTASKKGIIFVILLMVIYFLTALKSKKNISIIILFGLSFLYLINSGTLFEINGVDYMLKRLSTLENAGHSGSTYERYMLIVYAYEVFTQNIFTFLFGTGEGTFFLQNRFGLYAHNNYMEILANLGIIGLTLYYSIYIILFKNIKKLTNKQIKYFLYGFILILLIMDNALVSYIFKGTLLMFIFIITYIERKEEISFEK